MPEPGWWMPLVVVPGPFGGSAGQPLADADRAAASKPLYPICVVRLRLSSLRGSS